MTNCKIEKDFLPRLFLLPALFLNKHDRFMSITIERFMSRVKFSPWSESNLPLNSTRMHLEEVKVRRTHDANVAAEIVFMNHDCTMCRAIKCFDCH